MTLQDLKATLLAAPSEHLIALVLPDGGRVPAHFHVTEVGHVRKDFVDCGGKLRATRSCVLQTWTASDADDGHRLTTGKLVKILALAEPLFRDDALPVEVEYEDGLISQFPLADISRENGVLVLRLGWKHTDCLAKEKCGCAPDAGVDACATTSSCCSPAGDAAPNAVRCC